MPADQLSFDYILERMQRFRRDGARYFIFCNLYDVHWPYPPTAESVLQPWSSFASVAENLFFLPFVLPRITAHGYLRPNFRLSHRTRRLLRSRYHRAIELLDQKLAAFYEEAARVGLLDDTLLIVTSDHGEAFGEHGLYLHDASVYNTHLHVPLWVHHPDRTPETVDDLVTTRDLYGLMRAAGLGGSFHGTILHPGYRAAHPIAIAEHFYYPGVRDALPRYRQNIVAAIARADKVILRREGVEHYVLSRDPDEATPTGADLADFELRAQRNGVPASALAGVVASRFGTRHWNAA